MRLAIAADHRGHDAASALAERLTAREHMVRLHLSERDRASDYPDAAWTVARAVADGHAELGILICGTGVGTAIAANKVRGIRAAVVHDELTAEISRSHNNANVVCLSADLLGQRLIEKIVDIALETEFVGGRHERRTKKIDAIEAGVDPTTLNDS